MAKARHGTPDAETSRNLFLEYRNVVALGAAAAAFFYGAPPAQTEKHADQPPPQHDFAPEIAAIAKSISDIASSVSGLASTVREHGGRLDSMEGWVNKNIMDMREETYRNGIDEGWRRRMEAESRNAH